MNPAVDVVAVQQPSLDDTANITYENVQFMTVDNLKNFLRARCLPVSGSRDVLVSRVFSAIEMNIPVEVVGVDYVRVRKAQYESILDRLDIQDPFGENLSKKQWKNEHDSMLRWPDFTFIQLTKWLADNEQFNKNHLDKGYQFFASGWSKEILTLKLGEDRILFKNKCTHSQAISSLQHECWVAMDCQTAQVEAAYCSCVAG